MYLAHTDIVAGLHDFAGRLSLNEAEQLILEEWQAKGQPRADDMLSTYTRQLMERLSPP